MNSQNLYLFLLCIKFNLVSFDEEVHRLYRFPIIIADVVNINTTTPLETSLHQIDIAPAILKVSHARLSALHRR
jgi:hypothetical protein